MHGNDGKNLLNQWKDRMLDGDYDGAWQISDRALELRREDYEHRLPRHLRAVWDGQPLNGKRVLVRCYHGLGDTIQFIRYLALLETVAAEVIFCPQPALTGLFLQDPAIARFIHRGSGEPDHDADVEIMELAHVFRTNADTIPSRVPYLTTPAVAPRGNGNLAVGLVWKAGIWDDRRSIRFNELEPLAAVPHISLFSLQMDAAIAGWHEGSVIALDADTLTKTADIIQSLDLLITVDTMTAHLAGALGKPVWTLLQRDADWRWMRGRTDSPWYPTMRLFRQQEQGEWGDVITEVANELAHLAGVTDRAAFPQDQLPVPRHQFPALAVPPPPL